MTDVAKEIERLVRKALAERDLAPTARPHPPEACSQQAPSHSMPGELVVTSRVITLTELGERLAGVRRLVVPPRAIVTPAVRDELYRRNIELVVAEPKGGPAVQGTTAGLVVFVHGKQSDAASLLGALANEGIGVQPQQSDCIIAATEQLARQLARGGTLGVLLTRHTAAALCLANRYPGVRAILAGDMDRVAADAAAVGANLLIVDPTRNGAFRVRKMIGQFCRQGPQECPKVFETKLK